MKAIGIDLGTTSISLSVFDLDKNNIDETVTLPNHTFIPSEKSWKKIQDPDRIISIAKDALDILLNRHPDIVSIGLTGQMHGIVYLDHHGKAVSPLFTWQDQRGNLKEFEGQSMTQIIYETCRLAVPTGYGLNTHLYNLKKKEIPEEAVSLCTIPDYLGMILTGRKKPLIHSSMAASLGFFDCKNNLYLIHEIKKTKIEPHILPKVTNEISILGYYQGIPVTVAIGDCQASFLGSAGFKKDTLLLNIGTGSQISVLSDQYFQTLNIEARPFLYNQFLLCGSSLCGGRAYAVLENFFREYALIVGAENLPQYEFMAQLAQTAYSKNSSLTVKTTFSGTRSNPDEKGCILGLSEDNFTPGELILGVQKGMIQELADLYQEIKEKTEIQPHCIIASGNGFRKNPLLQKICAELFQLDFKLADHQEEAAAGAALSSSFIFNQTNMINK